MIRLAKSYQMSLQESYLVGVQLIRIALSITHNTNFHRKQDTGLLSLNEGEPWFAKVNVILLVEVVKYAHVCNFAGRLFFHIKLVLLGIEPGNLLDSPDFCL